MWFDINCTGQCKYILGIVQGQCKFALVNVWGIVQGKFTLVIDGDVARNLLVGDAKGN